MLERLARLDEEADLIFDDERLVPAKVDGRRIDFYTASLENIVIAKLYSGKPTDVQDIIEPKIIETIDWNRLEYLTKSEEEAQA